MPADRHIFICQKCGRGFLTAQPHAIDQYPEWLVTEGDSVVHGDVCGGGIEAVEWSTAMLIKTTYPREIS